MSNTRPAAADVARIQTRITHVFLADQGIDGLHVFVDGKPVLTGTIDSLTIDVVAPGDTDPVGRITAVLAVNETDAAGTRRQKAIPLFPGNVEIVAEGKRIVLSNPEQGVFEGFYFGVGMAPDGTTQDVNGVQSLRLLIAPGLIDSKLVWSDGLEETIL